MDFFFKIKKKRKELKQGSVCNNFETGNNGGGDGGIQEIKEQNKGGITDIGLGVVSVSGCESTHDGGKQVRQMARQVTAASQKESCQGYAQLATALCGVTEPTKQGLAQVVQHQCLCIRWMSHDVVTAYQTDRSSESLQGRMEGSQVRTQGAYRRDL